MTHDRIVSETQAYDDVCVAINREIRERERAESAEAERDDAMRAKTEIVGALKRTERELGNMLDNKADFAPEWVEIMEHWNEQVRNALSTSKWDEPLSVQSRLKQAEAERDALRLLKGMDALEVSCLGTWLKNGDIPETLERARLALVRRMLSAEKLNKCNEWNLQCANDRVAALEAALREAERDAERLLQDALRYRWLREQAASSPRSIHAVVETNAYGDGYTPNRPEMLDAVIDAARSALAAAQEKY